MKDTATHTTSVYCKPLLFALLVYGVLWLTGLAFVSQAFGIGPAIGLSVILLIPPVIAIRMQCSRQTPRRREYIFLGATCLIIVGAVVGLVWNWYSVGMDRDHIADMEYAEFVRLVHEDAAFRDVEVVASERGSLRSGRHLLWIRGTVPSQVDLFRLEALAAQYHIPWKGDSLSVGQRLESKSGRHLSDAKDSKD